jgi:hypothetical protein
MAKPWLDGVRKSGKLTVYDGLTSGKWVHLFKAALEGFNEVSKRYGLGVTMAKAADEKSANVVMRISSGVASYEYDGAAISESFDGKRLHGYTMLIGREGEREIEKAVVFLPSDPRSSAGFIRGKEVFEKANLDMMRVVAVHELIHACGLENGDHSDDGVFCGTMVPTGTGKVQAWGKKDARAMPPLFLIPSTVSKVASLWS